MTARKILPPFEARRDEHGYAVAISQGGWDIIHLRYSTRTEETVDQVVARLNAGPLDWPNRYNGRKKRALCARVAGEEK